MKKRTNMAVDRLNIPLEGNASPTAMRAKLKTHMINNGDRLLALKRRLPTRPRYRLSTAQSTLRLSKSWLRSEFLGLRK